MCPLVVTSELEAGVTLGVILKKHIQLKIT